jgi:mono/diheme cytochrome c family protein
MAEVVQNSTSHLTDADLKAMAEYLKSIPPESRLRTGLKMLDPTRAKGAALYMDNCGACHQAKGRGWPGLFPSLAGNGAVNASDPVDIIKVVLSGIPQRGDNLRTPMPSFEAGLNNQQIADIVNYVRTSWGNTAMPDVTTSMVAKLRQTSSNGAR